MEFALAVPLSVKDCLKRGALVTAANWHVVLVQFVADALFKTLLAVPVVGGVFLVVLLIGVAFWEFDPEGFGVFDGLGLVGGAVVEAV